MYTRASMCVMPKEARRGCHHVEIGKWTWDSLQEHPVSLTAEPSAQYQICMVLRVTWTFKIAQKVKALGNKADYSKYIFETHMVEGENHLSQATHWHPYMCHDMCVQTEHT